MNAQEVTNICLYLRTCTFQKSLHSSKRGEILDTGWPLGSYLRTRGLLHSLHHVLQDTGPLVPQWSWAQTSHRGSGPSTGKPRSLTPQAAMGGDLGTALSMRGLDPPSSQGLSPSLLTFCPSASLPAISIPVIYLHLDGPVRQRAHGGMDLTQHLRGLRMGPPAWPSHAPGPKGDGGTPTRLQGPSVKRQQPRRQRNYLEAFKSLRDRGSSKAALGLP